MREIRDLKISGDFIKKKILIYPISPAGKIPALKQVFFTYTIRYLYTNLNSLYPVPIVVNEAQREPITTGLGEAAAGSAPCRSANSIYL